MKTINFYRTKDMYGEFSNFASFPIEIDGAMATSEHYFQAQKFVGQTFTEVIRKELSPMKAAQMARLQPGLRADWDAVKDDVMRAALYAKFTQHSALRELLLGTGQAVLVEQTKNDSYWADGGDGTGKNRLGILLMELRLQLEENNQIERQVMKEDFDRLSKFLSYVLRHKPESIGLTLDSEGWANVDAIIVGASKTGKAVRRDMIERVVETSDKKRFSITPDKLKIRAVQGHSTSEVAIKFEEVVPPALLYHGTATRFLSSIRTQGLLPGSRHHVHLSADATVAVSVGVRHGKEVVLTVAAADMHAQGYKFYRSKNGVWLTDLVPSVFIAEPSETGDSTHGESTFKAPVDAVELPQRQIRAVYSDSTIRVYQAYSDSIALSAIENGRFIAPPFKMERMTWIKPSFLWMMYRAGWGFKDSGQSRILAIDISREGFEWALNNGCASHPSENMTPEEWEDLKAKSPVRIQWDPERDIRHNPLQHRAIQIGLSGEAVRRYVHEWTQEITDVTPLAHAIYAEVQKGNIAKAHELLPVEMPYL